VTEDLSDRILRLPFYNELTEADQASVIDAIKSFRGLGTATASPPITVTLNPAVTASAPAPARSAR
jgi:alpha-D-ribose 1-methylphosphonate 5-triphosphate synthase subunit PhnH